MSKTLRAGLIESQFDAHAAVNGITLRFSEGTALDSCNGFTNGKDVVDPPADPEVIVL